MSCLDNVLCYNLAQCEELKSSIDTIDKVQAKTVRSKKTVNTVLKQFHAVVNYEMFLCKYHGYPAYYQVARYWPFITGINQTFRFHMFLPMTIVTGSVWPMLALIHFLLPIMNFE